MINFIHTLPLPPQPASVTTTTHGEGDGWLIINLPKENLMPLQPDQAPPQPGVKSLTFELTADGVFDAHDQNDYHYKFAILDISKGTPTVVNTAVQPEPQTPPAKGAEQNTVTPAAGSPLTDPHAGHKHKGGN